MSQIKMLGNKMYNMHFRTQHKHLTNYNFIYTYIYFFVTYKRTYILYIPIIKETLWKNY